MPIRLFSSYRHLLTVLLILGIAGLFRAWLIVSDGAAFESDEAVVGLMARHITEGKTIPTFYYGQDYMGSLDAILVAGGFALFGESVDTLRAVQWVLYLIGLAAAYALARTVTGQHRIAATALLLLAIPTTLGALYSTITLGGYNEIVLLGSLILLFGWQVTVRARREWWRWAALGLAAGVGWWVNGAIITPCLVVVLLGLRYGALRQRRYWQRVALAGIVFMIGSAPWWIHNLRHDWAALDFLTGGFEPVPGVERISPAESLVGLLILGLPTIYGLRAPWEAGFSLSLGMGIAALVYLLLLTDALARGYARLRGNPHPPAPSPSVRRGEHIEQVSDQVPLPEGEGYRVRVNFWPWLVFGVFAVLFTVSSFSDATGRYLMPVWVPAAIGVAMGLDRLRRAGWIVPGIALALLLAFQAGSVIRAARSDSGLTPQLVERLQTPADHDAALIDFLADQGYTRGYAGYWTSYRLMFRAHEAVIFDTALPYDDKGYQSGNNRYPPYVEQVAAADRVVWITQNFPDLDAVIEARLAAANITYRTRDFGQFRVYYAFSERVAPAELGLDSDRPLAEIGE